MGGDGDAGTSIIPSPRNFKVLTKLYTDTGFNGVPDFLTDVNAASTVQSDQAWQIDTNQILMPRYKIDNSDPNTFNWCIVMTPSDVGQSANGSCNRAMVGLVCDEKENCFDLAIPIPYQVNIVNVADLSQLGILFPLATFPKSGFGIFDVILQGTGAAGNPCGNAGNEQYLGWSYLHTLGSANLETALILPMHRKVEQFGIVPQGQ
jgi:hypothetical protein